MTLLFSPIIFGSDTLNNSGSNDIYIAKYDPNGTVLWAKSARGSGDDYACSIQYNISLGCKPSHRGL